MLGRWVWQRVQRDPAIIRLGNLLRYSQSYVPSNRIRSSVLEQKTYILRPHHAIQTGHHQRPRTFTTAAISPVFVPPLIFIGLLVSLWAWKCFWIVLLQDKLLYISWLPPFARSERIADYENECRPVQWTEKQIRSLDGTKLAVCEGRIPVAQKQDPSNIHDQGVGAASRRKTVVICYFQGNGGSTPLRLPLLSTILRSVASSSPDGINYVVVALSYRGYWTSSGRATQSGIELDAQAFLDWVSKTYTTLDTDLQIILWGHSLGSAIASTAVATYLSRLESGQSPSTAAGSPVPITGLIMEAPTSSTKDMLISLYPQKWLPYRYLWPFLWNNWNSSIAMERMARYREIPSSVSLPPILLLCAEKDEVIPAHAADQLEGDGRRLGLDIRRKDVSGAMHTEAPLKIEGRKEMAKFIIQHSSGGTK